MHCVMYRSLLVKIGNSQTRAIFFGSYSIARTNDGQAPQTAERTALPARRTQSPSVVANEATPRRLEAFCSRPATWGLSYVGRRLGKRETPPRRRCVRKDREAHRHYYAAMDGLVQQQRRRTAYPKELSR